MRLRVFQANDGDCLLLSSTDNHQMLIDGGRSGSFVAHAYDTISGLGTLDVVCVSHIDDDHITGVLKLLDTEVDWRIHLFEKANPPRGRSPKRKPSLARPPAINEIWHNGFGSQLGSAAGDVRTMLSLAAAAQLSFSEPDLIPRQHYLADLAAGEEKAIELTDRISAEQLDIPLNRHFGGRLVRADGAARHFSLGSTELTVLGPFQEDLEQLQEEWIEWLRDNTATLDDLARQRIADAGRLGLSESMTFIRTFKDIAQAAGNLGNRSDVTTPNLASIMLLAEEGGRSILLTGDGAGQDIIKGLQRAGKLDANGRIHVDVLKMQHHGAAANINEEFVKTVTADKYVFCGNGSHTNPELDVVTLIADSRFGKPAQRSGHANVENSFELHFNSEVSVVNTKRRREHMTLLQTHTAAKAGTSGGQMVPTFHTSDFFDV